MKYIVLAAGLLAGCATPQQLIATGERTVHTLRLPPDKAAACMARNAEDAFSVYATARPLIDRPGSEVVLRSAPDAALAVAEVDPSGEGSRATIWLRREWFYRKGEYADAMAKGC